MILKEADDKSEQVQELERLLTIAPAKVKSKLERELRMLRSGIAGENKTRFYLDSKFRDSKNCYVIHDLRLEHDGEVAQIDHLLMNRFLEVYVLETKHAKSTIKVEEDGAFLRLQGKHYQGMPSPIEQNKRHVDVLKKVFKHQIDMPEKGGFKLQPTFQSRVLINPEVRIIRPKKFDTSEVIHSDTFSTKYQQDMEEFPGFFKAVGTLLKDVGQEQVAYLCRKLISLHKPISYNYVAKFGIEDKKKAAKPYPKRAGKLQKVEQSTADYSSHKCSKCNSDKIKIEPGKYGYYFKCADCGGNTSIKVDCGVKGHNARIRKKRNQFYLDCSECESSTLYFTNPN